MALMLSVTEGRKEGEREKSLRLALCRNAAKKR